MVWPEGVYKWRNRGSIYIIPNKTYYPYPDWSPVLLLSQPYSVVVIELYHNVVVAHFSCTTVLMCGTTSSTCVTVQQGYGNNVYVRRKGMIYILPLLRHLYTPSVQTIYWAKQNSPFKFDTYKVDSTLQTRQINHKCNTKSHQQISSSWPHTILCLLG